MIVSPMVQPSHCGSITKTFVSSSSIAVGIGFIVSGGSGIGFGIAIAALTTFFKIGTDNLRNYYSPNQKYKFITDTSIDLTACVLTSSLFKGSFGYHVTKATTSYIASRFSQLFFDKALDQLNIENQYVRNGLNFAAGLSTSLFMSNLLDTVFTPTVQIKQTERESVKSQTVECSELERRTQGNITFWIRPLNAQPALDIATKDHRLCLALYVGWENPNLSYAICYDPNPKLITCSDGRTGIRMSADNRLHLCSIRIEGFAEYKDQRSNLPFCNDPLPPTTDPFHLTTTPIQFITDTTTEPDNGTYNSSNDNG